MCSKRSLTSVAYNSLDFLLEKLFPYKIFARVVNGNKKLPWFSRQVMGYNRKLATFQVNNKPTFQKLIDHNY